MIHSINSRDSAFATIGQGTCRDVLANPHKNSIILLDDSLDNEKIKRLIIDFEANLFKSVKKILKAPRIEVLDSGARKKGFSTNQCIDGDQPFFFTGFWAVEANKNQTQRRFVFEIANSHILRSAAGLTGGGPRSLDYASFPNQNFLHIPWEEKQEIIDRAIGIDWKTLQSALKPKSTNFGVILPNLHEILEKKSNAKNFLKEILIQAQPKNNTGEVGRRTPQFLLWCFLAYLRKNNIILLPARSYHVDFVSDIDKQFFIDIILSEDQKEIINRLYNATKKYSKPAQKNMMRIAQTFFLTADIQTSGDINQDALAVITEAHLDSSPSITYRLKYLTFAQNVYSFLVALWNERCIDRPITQPSGHKLRDTERKRRDSQILIVDRRIDPFWFVEVPDDKWHKGHPISGYKPKAIVKNWAAILRKTFPHLKLKDPTRFRTAGRYWLTYINSLQDPPIGVAEILRNKHINDLIHRSEDTFRYRLEQSKLSPGMKNDILSSLSQMLEIWLRIYGSDIRNPIDFNLDRFITPQVRGKTPRTPLSPEMLIYLKEFNSRNDFEFSRSLKPINNTTKKIMHLRSYRRIIDPEDGVEKLIWWPGLPVLLDLQLTIPLRGHQSRWLDTGEGDEYTLDLDSLQDIPNELPSAQKGRQMGIFTSFPKNRKTTERLLGLRITTNKRPVEQDGRYGVPWCPEGIRNNIVMLLSWQRRYNPISIPVRAEKDTWTANFRSEEVTALIPKIFPLFRDPGTKNGTLPPTYQQVQTYWNQLCIAAEDELHATSKTKFRLTRDRTRITNNHEITERVALFDLHTLRVSGITALIEAGLPPHFVQEIVGHASIVMTLYYHKVSPGQINSAINDALESRELSLENIPEILDNLDNYDNFLLNNRVSEDAVGREMLASAIGNGSYQVLSHGICPGGDCRTGGEYEQAMKEHQPVPRAGACSLCRYRITGPMFLVGLVVNANKIMSELHAKGQQIAALNDEVRARQTSNKSTMAFESRREVFYRELESLWLEWAAEHRYAEDSASQLADYLNLKQKMQIGHQLPMLVAEGALEKINIKSESRHPFYLHQLLAEASAYIPSERHVQAITNRDAFLNELLANNNIDPFLLRLSTDARLYAGNMLGNLLGQMVPDQELQNLHDAVIPIEFFIDLNNAIQKFLQTDLTHSGIGHKNSAIIFHGLRDA